MGKTYIVKALEERINEAGLNAATIPSVNRQLAELGISGRTWFDQYLGSAVRTYAQLLYRKNAEDQCIDVLLSDRTMLDVAAYNRTYILLKATQGNVPGDAFYNVNQLTMLSLAADLENYWNLVYVKPPHPDFDIEGDGVRPEDLDQSSLHTHMIEILSQLRDDNGLTAASRVTMLPIDRDEAVESVWQDVKKVVFGG